jgi:hypothetical protein
VSCAWVARGIIETNERARAAAKAAPAAVTNRLVLNQGFPTGALAQASKVNGVRASDIGQTWFIVSPS